MGRARYSMTLGALALGALLGCEAAAPARAQPASCGDIAWGGYSGNDRCAALAARTIAGTHRGCGTDTDCELVHPGASCREQAVAREHVASYRAQPASCTHPAAGPCSTARPACSAGCCTVRR